MTNLHRLHDEQGQSPWLDNLSRDHLTGGRLTTFRATGIRGVTANPTILATAITGSAAYDHQFAQLIRAGASVEQTYWELVITDVTAALTELRRSTTPATATTASSRLSWPRTWPTTRPAASRRPAALHRRIDEPNLMVKIPATAAGITAIRQATAAGLSINVTLLFSLGRYAQTIEAYLSGLEAFAAAGGDLSRVHSVASFFVSRVDTAIDRRLDNILSGQRLRGRVAIAQARLAYAKFREAFSSPRWVALAAEGARVQRPLWASTSTKDPALPDTLYVDSLIGPDTITTLPETTIEAFNDHGTVAHTVDIDLDDATAVLAQTAETGVDLSDVGRALEDRGVAIFQRSFTEVLARLTAKADQVAPTPAGALITT